MAARTNQLEDTVREIVHTHQGEIEDKLFPQTVEGLGNEGLILAANKKSANKKPSGKKPSGGKKPPAGTSGDKKP